MIKETQFEDKGGGYKFATSGGVADQTLLGVATAFRSAVQRKFKTLQPRKLKSHCDEATEILATKKYDGEGVFVYIDGDTAIAFNAPSGRCRVGLKCLKEAAEKLKKNGKTKALLCAEIYLKDAEGRRTRCSDVARASAGTDTAEHDNLQLAFYDAVMLEGKDLRSWQENYKATLALLGEIFGEDTSAKTHKAEDCQGKGEKITFFFEKITKSGGEGIVLRHQGKPDVFKVKPTLTIDAVVIGYAEGEFEGNYGVTSLLCALEHPESKQLLITARVGSGFTDEERINLLPRLEKSKVNNPITMTDSDGRPINFVKPELVVEIEGEELIEEKLDGSEIKLQLLKYDGDKYEFQGTRKGKRLTHAVFGRWRPDKEFGTGDVRLQQVYKAQEIKEMLQPKTTLPEKTQVLRRSVWTKESKGKTAVKKLLVVQRHVHPTYAIHWTDFSEDRKDPLKTELKLAETEDRLKEITAAFEEEASKRGWVAT